MVGDGNEQAYPFAAAVPVVMTEVNDQSEPDADFPPDVLRQVLDSLFAFVGVLTPEGVVLAVNRAALHAAGLRPADLIGKPLAESYPWSYDPQIQTGLRAALVRVACGEIVRYDVPVRMAAGRMVTVDFMLAPLRDASGQITHLTASGIDVSERTMLTAALQHTEQRFQTALKNSPITVFQQDRDLRYIWIHNPALGYGTSDMLGARDRELFFDRPADSLILERLKRQVLETGTGLRQEVSIWSRGREHFYDLTIEPMTDTTGTVIGVACAAFDITERKDAELALQRANERLKLAVSALNGFIYEYDLASGQVTRSDGFSQFLGYAPDEAPGTAAWWQAQIHPGDRERLLHQTSDHLATGGRAVEYRVRRKDGVYIYVWDQARVAYDNDGKASRLVGVTIDITARKLAEERQRFLVEAGKLLASSLDYEETVQSLADLSVPRFADLCVIFLEEPDGRIKRVASAHVDAGKAAQLRELQQRPPLDPGDAHPAVVVMRNGQPTLNPPIPDAVVWAAAADDEQTRRRRGLIPRSHIIVPMIARQRVIGALSFGIDNDERVYNDDDLVTAMKLADRAALAVENAWLYRQSQDAVRLRDSFLSIASHELRTPLTALLGQAQLLQRRMTSGGTATERDQRTLRVIVDQAARLNKLIGTLLDVSRLELGQFHIAHVRFDMGALLRRVAEEMQAGLEQHTISLTLPDEALMIVGDEQRLEQVLQNLIQNAIKYSPQGGPVELQVQYDAQRISVAVRDYGIGIPAHALPQLFQRFYRAENVVHQHINGIGIGLYVVKEVVALHGGEVSVESVEGQGSIFRFTLPRGTSEGNPT